MPAPFDQALYGTATDARGIGIRFAFFFGGRDSGDTQYRRSMLKLVPESTEEDVEQASSLVLITSARHPGGSFQYGGYTPTAREEEEEGISRTMYYKVKFLARTEALREGP